MSCIWHNFAYSYKHGKSMRGYRNKSDRYNWLTRRYKRRNRHPRYKCKKHKDFCVLMDSFGYHRVVESMSLINIKQRLQPFLLWLKKEYELVLLDTDPDFRSGFETYDYIDKEGLYTAEEHIKNQLWYISDRWQCSFRVRWIINLLDPDYKPFIAETKKYYEVLTNG